MFVNELRFKCLDFFTASGQTLCAKSVETIAIPLVNKSSIRLEKVAYASEYDFNLILLDQLYKNNITYINNKDVMILVERDYIITHVKRDRNLFIIDLAIPNKVI